MSKVTKLAPYRAFVAYAGIIAGCLWLIPAMGVSQTQQSVSLADAARQARAQKQAQSGGDVNSAQQMADELSDDQNKSDNAPAGFKTYNTSDYTLWVPAPFDVGGHDDAGTVLSGPVVGSKRTIILVGTPFLLPPGSGDEAFHDAAAQFARVYAQSANCSKAAEGSRSAYECSLAVADLAGTRVSGTARFLRSANTVYPVFCAAPSDSRNRDYLNKPRGAFKDTAREGLDREEQDMRSVWQKCDTVFQSVRTKEKSAQQVAAQEQVAPPRPPASGGNIVPGPALLADSPRQPKHDAATATAASVTDSTTPGSTVPAGLKVQAFQYCAAAHQCWDGSVLVPTGAQLISSDCRQYAFETKIQGSPFLLMAGPTDSDCDGRGESSVVRWKELVDPESKRAPGTYSTISSQTRKLDGRPALVTTMEFRKGLTDWMGKRAEVESNGVQVVVGCIAPREHFADGDAMCSALIESLRLP